MGSMHSLLPPFISEPGPVYRSKRNQYLTSHQLADFRWCPLAHRQKATGLFPERRNDDYVVGAATHALTLEGQAAFDSEFQVGGGPINPTTGKPYGTETKKHAEWAAQQAKAILSEQQYSLICQMYAAVQQHDNARELLAKGTPEGVLRAEYCGVPCQIRCDWWHPLFGLIDLKTCYSLDRFEEDAIKYGYPQQLAFYLAVAELACGIKANAYLIAVEKWEPFRVGVWALSKQRLAIARIENEAAIEELKISRQQNYWPTRYESIRSL